MRRRIKNQEIYILFIINTLGKSIGASYINLYNGVFISVITYILKENTLKGVK